MSFTIVRGVHSSILGTRPGQSSLTHKCVPNPATEQTQRVLLQRRLSTDSHDFGNEACYRTTIAMHTDAHRPCLCSMRHLLTILEQPCFRAGTGFAWSTYQATRLGRNDAFRDVTCIVCRRKKYNSTCISHNFWIRDAK